ncbi:GNAT family N-acetyltransferase [Spirosoma sp. BT702]|uniref:GNAT family N-acetyltransferase n=1 Tax=Spirosoma profusum TaxID=2771354 RepID=A0A926XVW8_9BACT|nr:GNAT family N-acetyltransferase [Spirosoma profusum]MBD2701394.1 GNAT family N-acetyltransferase [Spirosoma profusum]
MNYIITEASPDDDLPHHLLLLADENQALIDAYLPSSQVYLLRIDTTCLGICLLQYRGEIGEIMNIAVEPDYQGKGLGRALLAHVIDAAGRQGVQRLLIKTGNSGIGQIALYQQQGFDLIGVNYNYFLEAYSDPIWENGIQCKHQLVFELRLRM